MADESYRGTFEQKFFDELRPDAAAILANFRVAVAGQVDEIKILRRFEIYFRAVEINRLRFTRRLRSPRETPAIRQRIYQRRFSDVRAPDKNNFGENFSGVLRNVDSARHVLAFRDSVNFIFHSGKNYSTFRAVVVECGERNFGGDALKNFREMYRKICLVTGSDVLSKVNQRDVFDYPPDENLDGFVTYGYVDAETGFNFKILAGAQLDGDKIKIVPASYKKNFSIRRAEILGAKVQILPDKFASAFKDRLQVISDAYAQDAAKEQTRLVKTIDALRHPNFPDDVAVYFHGEKFQPELGWVRCVSVEGNLICGVLIHELQQDFGVHTGDAVKFGVADFNGEIICAVIW